MLVATALASLAVYGFHFFASRRLGVDRYGALASLLAAVTLINAVSTVGATIVARFAAEFEALEDRGRLRRLLDVLTRSCAILFTVGGITAFVFRAPLAAFLRIEISGFVVMAAILAGLTVTAGLLRGLLQGTQRFVSFSLSSIIENVGRAALAAVFVLIGFGIPGVLFGQIIAAIVATAYTYVGLRTALCAPPVMLRIDLRRLVVTSGAIAAASLSLSMLAYFDLILAKHYLTPHDAGLYGFAILPGRMLSAIISFLPTLILPKATARAAIGRPGHAILYAGIGVAAALGLAALGFFYVFAARIVLTIAGPAFISAAPLIFPYGCAAAAFGLTSIAVAYQMGRHRFDFVLPLLLIVVCEVVAIALVHETAAEIVLIVLIANVLAFFAAIFRVTASPG